MELCFGLYLVIELVIRLCLETWAEYFCGSDCLWNYFDMAIVVLALFDVFVFFLAEEGSTSDMKLSVNTKVARLVRLLRIVRMLRVIRLPILKDLRIMLTGIFSGLQTLGWAFFILLALIWALGLCLQQVLSWEVHCDAEDQICKAARKALEPQLINLGGSMERSMFTVFRCLTDGCAAADGTPLMVLMWDVYGWGVIAAYVLTVLFVTFGVFNLIMAMLVEKTLAGTEIDATRRSETQYWEHVRVAQQLQEVVMKICHGKQQMKRPSAKNRRVGQVCGIMNWLCGIMNWLCGKDSQRRECTDESQEASIDYANLQVHIDRKDFEAVFDTEEVSELLNALEISVTSGGKLFDILDSDGSGWVDTAEVAEGLLKLRGPVDKGDIVSTVLMVRHVQKTLHEIQQDQEKLKEIVVPLRNIAENGVRHSRRSDLAAPFTFESF